jgi:hypothetical protein
MYFLFLSFMYHIKICNRIKLYVFIKFIVHKINSEMIKSGMVVLTERENANVAEANAVAAAG